MYLQTVLIKPTSSLCNMHCDYCFYCDEAAKRETASYGMMSEHTLKNIIKKTLFQAQSDICFAFQGGEPTLRGLPFFQKVIDFETRFNRNTVRISNVIQTNGLLIDTDWCKFFKENHFLVGISVDGTQTTHDMCRHTKSGASTYVKIKQSIHLLEQYQVDYNILTVVNAFTAPAICEIYQEYKQNGWNYQQYITCLEPLGEDARKHPYSLTPSMYGKFLIQLFDMWYKDWKRGKAPYIRQFENYIGILMGYPPESCEQRGICSMQGVIEADGSVYPCDFYVLDPYKLGSFNENAISDFFENKRAKDFIEESKNISSACKNCEYYTLCRGGCKRSRIKEPDGTAYRSYFCESYRMFFAKEGKRLEEIAKFLRK
ncbi:anaerobic sulfatase maturase [Mediterraneibacter massiliensis]|uniref:anaerobic sulfatase maturase n=1 Tax=Mediterraneibacter massiliensis TaxID=1720300 RepID=UPI0022E93DF0|nr:anaerobic sulfatase maturase [Mediterraneibacter massiliensis]